MIPVVSDQVEYLTESSRTAGAAAVAEAIATTGATGLKPEGGIVFAKVTQSVKTTALWVPATTRVIADAPQPRAYIDDYLGADIQTELEDLIVEGRRGRRELAIRTSRRQQRAAIDAHLLWAAGISLLSPSSE